MKARIKGTDFELEIMDAIGSGDYTWRAKHPSARGAYIFIPQEWVEFYEPEREEPPVGSAEIDKDGDIWVRFRDGWSVSHDDCSDDDIGNWNEPWQKLQDTWGPTRPMKVVEE